MRGKILASCMKLGESFIYVEYVKAMILEEKCE